MSSASASMLEIDVPADAADDACGRLWLTGEVVAIEERASADGSAVVLRVGLRDRAHPDQVRDSLGGEWPVRILTVDPDEWVDDARALATVVRAGRRLVLVPPSCSYEPRPGELVVALDAGASFGSGSHPTTRLALAAVDGCVRPGATVLDVGCGSGVLAVAAALLGAGAVRAIDIDPRAVEATLANVRANGVGPRVVVTVDAVDAVDGEYDVVVANITAGVLIELAASLVARTRPGATLLLTGVLDRRVDEVTATFDALGCSVAEVELDDGWALLALVRHRPAAPN